MIIFLFLSIVLIAILSAAIFYQVSKNRELSQYVKLAKEQESRQKPSPVFGINQETWDRICEEMIDSSEDMMLFFDSQKKLRLWNKTAGSIYQFEEGIGLDQVNEALSLESSPIFNRAIENLNSAENQKVHSLKMLWKNGYEAKHRIVGIPSLEKDKTLEAIAIFGTPIVKPVYQAPQEQLTLLKNLKTPIEELGRWNDQLNDSLSEKTLRKENLIHISDSQGLLIQTSDQVLQYINNSNSKRSNFEIEKEEVNSVSANAMVKGLQMILSSSKASDRDSYTSSIQAKDFYLLVPVGKVHQYIVELIDSLRENFAKQNCAYKTHISWRLEPMEVLVSFEVSFSILGQEIGASTIDMIINNSEKVQANLQESFVHSGCELRPFKFAQSKLLIELVCPRDLA